MPSVEDRPVIQFYEYPGGPPITLEEQYLIDDLGAEVVEPRSYIPGIPGFQWLQRLDRGNGLRRIQA